MSQHTRIEALMDLDEIFGSSGNSNGRNDKGYVSHSMDNMPQQSFERFEDKMMNENLERQTQMKPIQGKIRNNVNMSKAMNGGNSINSGSIYPSRPQMNYPAEITNTSYNEFRNNDAQNYEFGPRAYPLNKPGNNSYGTLVEGFHDRELSCIEVANHIKSCPICSKFYDNDKSMYIITIIILIVICIILIRKILENYEK